MINNFLLMKLNRVAWVSLLRQEKIAEGIRVFETYIVNFLQMQNNRELKNKAEEEISYSTAVFLEMISKLADKYYNSQDWPNAAMCYAAYFKYDPHDTNIMKNFIETLDYMQQFDLVLDLLAQIEASMNVNNPQAYKLLADIYSKRKEYQKAINYMNKYMDIKKEDLTAHDYNLLGCYYNLKFSDSARNINDASKGLAAFEKASDMSPYTKIYAKNATIMAGKIGDIESGEKHWKRVLEIGGLNNDDKYDYAAFCLKTGDFVGWREYFGSRFEKEHNATQFPKIENKPEWDGEQDLSNLTLLVHFEQGFGDTFLMYGYMPKLVKLAKRVIFIVQDSVYPLIKDNEYGVEVLQASLYQDLSKVKFDYYIPSMSIPVVLKLAGRNLSVGEGYIKADPKLVQKLKKEIFNNDKFKIGLSVCGSDSGDKTRDLDLKCLLPLEELDNIELYSINKDISDEKFAIFKKNKVNNIGKRFEDFAQTAAAIENCDLIISTDNVILNLAGALGKKTFGLFNNPSQFRWFDLEGEDVVWLTSVKPFVNKEFDKWEPTIERIVKEIKKMI